MSPLQVLWVLAKLARWIIKPTTKIKNTVPMDHMGVPVMVKSNRHSRRATESFERRMRNNK